MTPESSVEDGVMKQSSFRKPGGGLMGVMTVVGDTRSAIPLSRVKLMEQGRLAGWGDTWWRSDQDAASVAVSSVVEILAHDDHWLLLLANLCPTIADGGSKGVAGRDMDCDTAKPSVAWFDSIEDNDDDVEHDAVDNDDVDVRVDFGGRLTNNTDESVPWGNDDAASGIVTNTLHDLQELHCSLTGISVSSTYGIFW